ncbi:MAG: hypothetical protein IPM84_19990 [Anaerolineae bacterium]|nr:hypothetical protein [Anaerolineae bacterium]
MSCPHHVAVGDGGLQILDVTDPGQPTLLGSYDTIGYAFDVAINALPGL